MTGLCTGNYILGQSVSLKKSVIFFPVNTSLAFKQSQGKWDEFPKILP